MDLTLADKVLKKTPLDLQRTFPDIPCVSQILGGLSLRLGIPRERLSIPPGSGKGGKNAGWLVTWDCPLRTDSASSMLLLFSVSLFFKWCLKMKDSPFEHFLLVVHRVRFLTSRSWLESFPLPFEFRLHFCHGCSMFFWSTYRRTISFNQWYGSFPFWTVLHVFRHKVCHS